MEGVGKMRHKVNGDYLLDTVVVMGFMKHVYAKKCGYDLKEGIIIVFEDDIQALKFLKIMEEKTEAEILHNLKELKRIENYRIIIHKYRKSDKSEDLYKFLDFSEMLTVLVVSGIVPDDLEEYAYIFKMPSCSSDDWQRIGIKYKELKELATQKGLIIQESLEILEKSSLFQKYCQPGDYEELRKIFVATAEILGMLKKGKLTERMVYDLKELHCEKLMAKLPEIEDFHGSTDVRGAIRGLVFSYINNSPNMQARDIAEGLTKESNVIYYDETSYYFPEDLLKEICKPIAETTSFLHMKREMAYVGMLEINQIEKGGFTVKKAIWDSGNEHMIRLRFLKIVKNELRSEEGLAIEDYIEMQREEQ